MKGNNKINLKYFTYRYWYMCVIDLLYHPGIYFDTQLHFPLTQPQHASRFQNYPTLHPRNILWTWRDKSR